MQAVYSSASHLPREILKTSTSGALGSLSNANKALLQI